MARLPGTATATCRGRAHVRTQPIRKAFVNAITLLAQEKQANPFGSLVILVPLVLAFYFVAIRPGRRRMQAMQQVQATLAPGRDVVTTAGLYATVTEVDEAEGTLTLEIAPGVHVKFARGAVMKVVDEPVPDETPALAADDE